MVKLQESNGQFFITIPKEYVQRMKWKKGDVLIININERKNIELENMKKAGGKQMSEVDIKACLAEAFVNVLTDEKTKAISITVNGKEVKIK